MQLVIPPLPGEERFQDAAQAATPPVATGPNAGVWTGSLMNCIGVALSDGTSCSLAHIEPMQPNQPAIIDALFNQVPNATHAMVCGGNSVGNQAARATALQLLFANRAVTIIDETKAGWAPQAVPNCPYVRGSNRSLIGYAAVASNGDYRLGSYQAYMIKDIQAPPPGVGGDTSAKVNRGCVIM